MTSSIASLLSSQAGVLALILARVLGLSWTAPALATPGADWRIRLGLAALLAAILLPVVGAGVVAPEGLQGIARACLVEAAVGGALGWSAALIVAGARQAGEIVGAQAGLSAAALFDPDAGDDLNALGHLYALIALATFLALDGPLALVRGVAGSYRAFPAGGAGLTAESLGLVFGRVGEALALALRASAPPALALAMAGAALGLLGRAAPGLSLVWLSLPVRAALGLLLVGLGMITLIATLTAAWGGWPGGG